MRVIRALFCALLVSCISKALTFPIHVTCVDLEKKQKIQLIFSEDSHQDVTTVTGSFTNKIETRMINQRSWFQQRFDFDNNITYAGFFIPFNENPQSRDNYISLFFEFKNQKLAPKGWAEISVTTNEPRFFKIPCERQ